MLWRLDLLGRIVELVDVAGRENMAKNCSTKIDQEYPEYVQQSGVKL